MAIQELGFDLERRTIRGEADNQPDSLVYAIS